ncbi:hypothetical protein FRUB_07165 [Fimbriiglobus ruber]|uniref:Uncharacterized protein n=1 Tax=Fimbriiglobus ruber TaxID=1908690 RepID=A0A225DNW5_9BACT|nr:hypothetical protein FRUB_07165 [Fimbriiglobus ruber]
MWFVPLLAPLVWAGVTDFRRGRWKRAIGAWLVVFCQYFAMIYNMTHELSGLGVWLCWVYLD